MSEYIEPEQRREELEAAVSAIPRFLESAKEETSDAEALRRSLATIEQYLLLLDPENLSKLDGQLLSGNPDSYLKFGTAKHTAATGKFFDTLTELKSQLLNRVELLGKMERLPGLKIELSNALTQLRDNSQERDPEKRTTISTKEVLEKAGLLQELSLASNDVMGFQIAMQIFNLLTTLVLREEIDQLRAQLSDRGLEPQSVPAIDSAKTSQFNKRKGEVQRDDGWWAVEGLLPMGFNPIPRRIRTEFAREKRVVLRRFNESERNVHETYQLLLGKVIGFQRLNSKEAVRKQIRLLFGTHNENFVLLKSRSQEELALFAHLLVALKKSDKSSGFEYRIRKEISVNISEETKSRIDEIATKILQGSVSAQDGIRTVTIVEGPLKLFLEDILADEFLEQGLLERKSSHVANPDQTSQIQPNNRDVGATTTEMNKEALKNEVSEKLKEFGIQVDWNTRVDTESSVAGLLLLQLRARDVLRGTSLEVPIQKNQVLHYVLSLGQSSDANATRDLSSLLSWLRA